MLKNDVLKVIQKVAEERGFKFTLQDVDELLKVMEDAYVAIGEELEVGEKANVGAVQVVKKEVAGRKGISKLGDKDVEWETPDKIVIDLKAKASFKKEHEQEVE